MSTDPAVRWQPAKPGETPGSLTPGEDEAAPLPAPTLVPVVRPNGKVYRPRNRPRAVRVEVEDWRSDYSEVVTVLGTHDVERARALALRLASDVSERPLWGEQWYRLAIRNGDRVYVQDEVRGAPGLDFGVVDG